MLHDMDMDRELIHQPHIRRVNVNADDVKEIIPFAVTALNVFAPLPTSLDPMTCRYAMDGNNRVSVYHPLVIERNYPLVINGGNHLFIQIGIDGYTANVTRSRSTLAVYFALANTERAHYTNLENVHVLMLVPPGVHLSDVLLPIRRDLIKLQQGIQTYDHESSESTTLLTASPANFPADLPQVLTILCCFFFVCRIKYVF